jgi:transcriptional regulator with XRE-family HTH domain
MDSRSSQVAGLRPHPVGDLLRGWRNRRAMSQADLAFEAGISIKHLSHVETGKAAGSRDILLQLAAALGLSLRDRNALLEAGGFAGQYGERDLSARWLRFAPAVRRAASMPPRVPVFPARPRSAAPTRAGNSGSIAVQTPAAARRSPAPHRWRLLLRTDRRESRRFARSIAPCSGRSRSRRPAGAT